MGEISTDLNKRKAHEFDEVEAEQQERLLKRKVTAAFNNFRKKVEEYTAADGEASAAPIEFDTPFRELAFFGVPGRSTVLLQPTTHALVSLVEQPAFVLTLEDVERVHFERVRRARRRGVAAGTLTLVCMSGGGFTCPGGVFAEQL